MPKCSAQAKRWSYEDICGIGHIQSILREYIETEKDKSALFRMSIVNYELGALTKKIVYRQVAPKSPRCGKKEDVRVDIGDAMVNLIMLADIMGISATEAFGEAVERLENKEWRKV